MCFTLSQNPFVFQASFPIFGKESFAGRVRSTERVCSARMSGKKEIACSLAAGRLRCCEPRDFGLNTGMEAGITPGVGKEKST